MIPQPAPTSLRAAVHTDPEWLLGDDQETCESGLPHESSLLR